MLLILVIIAGPAVILYFLKVNAVFVYLSLCMGEVLSFFLGSSASTNNLVLNNELIHSHLKSNNDIRLGLLLLPVVLTTIFMIRTASTKKISLNIVPAIAVGLLAVYLVVPLLNFADRLGVPKSTIWQKLVLYQPEVIGGTALIILIMLFIQRFNLGSHRSKKHS